MIELTIPPGADGRNGVGAKPLLTVANATGGGDEREREEEEEEEESDGGGGGKKIIRFDEYRAGACDPPARCGWVAASADAISNTDRPPNRSVFELASARLAGPVSAYRLGGTPLFVPPAAGGARFARSPYAVVPSLPTPTYHAGSAYRAWEARAQVHRLTIANVSLARGSYVVAVTNTGEIPLPSFLAGVADLRGGGRRWGARPGFAAATRAVNFTVATRVFEGREAVVPDPRANADEDATTPEGSRSDPDAPSETSPRGGVAEGRRSVPARARATAGERADARRRPPGRPRSATGASTSPSPPRSTRSPRARRSASAGGITSASTSAAPPTATRR